MAIEGVRQPQQIVIDDRVTAALIARGRQLGYDCLNVREIYDDNAASQRLFEGAGFVKTEKTAKGWRYCLQL